MVGLIKGLCTKGHRRMNWDRMEGEWKQRRGKAVHHWGKMMNDELAAIAGKYEQLVGRLQEKYGIASEKSKRQVDDFKKLGVGIIRVGTQHYYLASRVVADNLRKGAALNAVQIAEILVKQEKLGTGTSFS